jgi:hypothetical protein
MYQSFKHEFIVINFDIRKHDFSNKHLKGDLIAAVDEWYSERSPLSNKVCILYETSPLGGLRHSR